MEEKTGSNHNLCKKIQPWVASSQSDRTATSLGVWFKSGGWKVKKKTEKRVVKQLWRLTVQAQLEGDGSSGRKRGGKKTMNKWLHERVRGKYGAKWIKVHKRTRMKEKQTSSRRFSSKDFVKEVRQSGRKCWRHGGKIYLQLNPDLLSSLIYQGHIKLWCQCFEKLSYFYYHV